jgi:Tol biopolymer transport system component
MGARHASRAALVLASLIAMLALLVLPAEAAFPGRNGAIVFVRTYRHTYHGDIWRISRKGGSPVRLTTDSRDDDEPAWSPNGSRIVFQRLLRSADGEQQIIVTNENGRNNEVVGYFIAGGHPTWSPDGARIAYEAHIDAQTMAILNLRTEDVAVLEPPAKAPFAPAWSPDGARIAYEANAPRRFDLFTMKPTGRDRRRLTNTRAWEYLPDWSPDGERIVFIRAHGAHAGDIFVIRAGGGGVTRLTDTPFDESSAAFSPNGKRIVFSRCCFGAYETSEIFVMARDGTHVIRLTHNDANDTAPDWQPIPRGH